MRKTKRFAVGSAIVVGAMGAGIAFAAWTTDGTGSGFAQATSAEDLYTDSATTSAQLYPGGSGDLVIKIVNDNPYPVRVTEINNAAVGSIVSDKGADCDLLTGVTFTNSTGTWDIPADSFDTFTLAGAVAMSNDSHTSCQGAIFEIPVDLVGASNAAP